MRINYAIDKSKKRKTKKQRLLLFEYVNDYIDLHYYL